MYLYETFSACSDWLLKLQLVSAFHLPALFWILHASFFSLLRKKVLAIHWFGTAVRTKMIIYLSVSEEG